MQRIKRELYSLWERLKDMPKKSFFIHFRMSAAVLPEDRLAEKITYKKMPLFY
jgi:hypothetical protein